MAPIGKDKVVDTMLPFFFKSNQNVDDMSPLVILPLLMLSFEANSNGSEVELNFGF
jgi:hypothetical protein